MLPGQWTAETASGHPAIMCDSCEAVQEIDPAVYSIHENGRVTPVYSCENDDCSRCDWLNLESYDDDDLDRN